MNGTHAQSSFDAQLQWALAKTGANINLGGLTSQAVQAMLANPLLALGEHWKGY
jgi:hypothetical protein